ncbi:MurR/RpiR family transcriptional regulator [Amycolatopsis rubida]|uniref:DNA-binding transcriptional regulator, MurR/RpiR family, contains HTH and SIS domains n=1 Tax=Amycolatopsis rubida TaxID=112413 RepID=A0A1I5SHV5_9PSEU|nr:MurR/RpiR family transcriptional regulator [Amycolatopsis rubida]SFP70067.1 DNA-binding transcriptional regulator, MurR/RpiR family, contains HTH and SIS domains [Amycolatopsis rubida]
MSDQPAGSTLAVIRAALPALLPSEQRVAEVVLSRSTEVIDWSVADLAAAAGTSSATAVRACQHLGFRGFQQLRLLLARDAGNAAQPASPDFGPGDSPEAVAAAVFATASGVLAGGMGAVEPAALREAVDVLVSARRVVFVANGGSGFVAQAAAFRFTAHGFIAEAPGEAISQQIVCRLLTSEDVCVAISSSGVNEVTLRAAEAAAKAGATVVGVTSLTHSPLTALADLVLVTGTAPFQRNDVFAGPMSQLALLVSLQLAAGFRRPDRSSEVLDEVWQVITSDTRRS